MKLFKEIRENQSFIKEEILAEGISMPRSEFDALKKGDELVVHFNSTIKKGHKVTLKIKSKSRSAKYNVDKINLVSVPSGSKYTLYSRQGKDATLAMGDMATTMTHIEYPKGKVQKESVELSEASVIPQIKDIVAKKQAKKIQGVLVDMFTASAISQIYDKVNDTNKAKMDKMKITQLANAAMKIMQKESVNTEKTLTPAEKKKREEIAKAIEKENPDMPMDKKMAIATATAKRVAEGKNDYPIYHKTYSDAMQASYAFAKKKGYEVDKDDIDSKVAFGPRKPSSGKTNSFTLKLVGEKKKMLAVQVTNLDNRRYELNCYIT